MCRGYKAPDVLDPRMLDPKCVFESLDEDPGDGTKTGKGGQKVNIFHEKFFEKKRQRQGYDMTKLDFSMRSIGTVSEFMSGSLNDAVQMLSEHTGMRFTEECSFYKNHKLTTAEIKTCLADLKVLNRSDFKGILTWRQKLIDEQEKLKAEGKDGSDEKIDEEDSEPEKVDEDEEEQRIQEEISELRRQKLREIKRKKKKERELVSKRRHRAARALNLDLNDVHESERIFSLSQIQSASQLEAVREVDLEKVKADSDSEDEAQIKKLEALEKGQDNVDDLSSQGEEDDLDEDTGYSYRLDRELDAAYDTYLKGTNNKAAKSGTKLDKRQKKLRKEKAKKAAEEDKDLAEEIDVSAVDGDTMAYAKLLKTGARSTSTSGGDSDDSDSDKGGSSSSDDESDDGFHAEPLTPEEHAAAVVVEKKKKQKDSEGNPLILSLPDDPASVKAARWFSNPLFANIANIADQSKNTAGTDKDDYSSDSDDQEDVQMIDSDEDENEDEDDQPKGKSKNKSKNKGLSADDILASIPKTDKEKRHEKRLKALARAERKKKRLAKLAGEDEADFEIVSSTKQETNKDSAANSDKKKKTDEERALLMAGLGLSAKDAASMNDDSGFEVVPASHNPNLPKIDDREYNSDTELYDSDDQAQTLALATMTLRHSKAKALVDASYNRYAWNDPTDLPEWFIDDESKNYRPQLPIPPALLAKMKERYLQLAAKPIAKVAEARARKSKRAKSKLVAAKKKAETIANNSDMSESMKLKAISKAMRGQDARRPSSTYVVSSKSTGGKSGKGIKLVDKRMKNDKRAMSRADKKRKKGKQGGLTGSKKRRNHS